MNVGLDAKWFFDGPSSNRLVVKNLVQSLLKLKTNHRFYIFLNKKDRAKAWPLDVANVSIVYIWGGNTLLSNLFVLPLFCRRLGLDVVLFQNFSPFFSSCKRVAFIFDVIFSTHPKFFTLKERLYFSPMKVLSLRAHRICTISHSEKARILRQGYARCPDAVDVIHLGVDDSFKPRAEHDPSILREVSERYRLPDNFILYVGRLNERKNLGNLLRAMTHLRNQSIPLVLIGTKDWKMFDIEKYMLLLGVEDRVQMLGYVQDGDLAPLFALSTLHCYVSYEEGFGLPPLEAMASGVPVVVAHSSSLPEVCGEAGTYVDPDNPSDIAEKIESLLDNPEHYANQSKRGIAQAKKFSWQVAAEALLKSFEMA